ncbi:glycosyltransferase [Desertivirga xinjiangensis]|uniref:glycosyltransferase n=1 Tax=Desertivirga xinjiangensis TaxID=539206 RepID=UPI0021097C75|nr:glycosyltransferase [Pedobacter xinjiangensis]
MDLIANSAWAVIQVIIGYNLVLPLLLAVFVFIAGRKGSRTGIVPVEADYAIIVTAYQYTDNLKAVVASLSKLRYSNYLIYIVADNCDTSGLSFDNDKVILLRPETVLASNTRSHFYAIRNFKRDHERLTIIDSDNLVHPDYLNQLNVFFDQGFEAVQGVREAKNLDTTYACLDAARDIYYHYYDGKLLFEAGSSATLAGSGMAFTVSLYRDCLEAKDITGAGFDKILQSEIIKRDKRIAFAPDALVYDEKTSRSDQLVNQRARWINTWFRYFRFGFVLLGKGFISLSWNQVLFGLTLLRPPLFIFLILSFILMVVNIFWAPIVAGLWLAGFFCFVTGFIIALKSSDTDERIYSSLGGIPKFMFFQLVSLTNIFRANKRSVSTQHYHHNQESNAVK